MRSREVLHQSAQITAQHVGHARVQSLLRSWEL